MEIWAGGAAFDPPDLPVFCSAPNLPIPDNTPSGVDDVITVGSAGLLTDLDLYVRIEHTWVGDLRVRLRHLDTGTTSTIINRPGRPPGAGCSGDDIDATLDDEAASPIEDECVTPGPIAIEGIFSPNQPLDRFDGEDVSGDWQLRVSDRAGFDIGTLLEWCLMPSVQ